MTHNPSRKEFVAKLLGASAALGVAPKLLAKMDAADAASPAPKPASSRPAKFELRHDSRAVARRDSL